MGDCLYRPQPLEAGQGAESDCSVADSCRSKADITPIEEPPNGGPTAGDLPFLHGCNDLVQRQVWLFGNQAQEKIRIFLQGRGAAAARLCGNAPVSSKRRAQSTTTL